MGSFTDEKYRPSSDDLIKMRDAGHTRPPLYLRLPVIRHIRALRMCYRVNEHYDRWAQVGAIAWNSKWDYMICNALWNNFLLEQPQ